MALYSIRPKEPGSRNLTRKAPSGHRYHFACSANGIFRYTYFESSWPRVDEDVQFFKDNPVFEVKEGKILNVAYVAPVEESKKPKPYLEPRPVPVTKKAAIKGKVK